MAGMLKIADDSFVQKTSGLSSTLYDSGDLTVANGQTVFDAKADAGTDLWVNVPTAHYTEIRTNYAITVKLNATTNGPITIAAADSPYIIDQIAVTNIFIANASGNGATVKVLLV